MSETPSSDAPSPAPHARPGGSPPKPDLARCPICGCDGLVEFAGRAHARCEACDALERHRALARQAAELLGDGGGRAALEVGPMSPRVFGGFLRDRGWRYQCIDQSRRGNPNDPRVVDFIDHEADLCDLSMFVADSIDLVIVQHVIEEIPAFELALAEIARVLGVEATALLEIPFNPALEHSQRHAPNHYGNAWRFGADLPGTVAEHFAEVKLLHLREAEYAGRLLVCWHAQ